MKNRALLESYITNNFVSSNVKILEISDIHAVLCSLERPNCGINLFINPNYDSVVDAIGTGENEGYKKRRVLSDGMWRYIDI